MSVDLNRKLPEKENINDNNIFKLLSSLVKPIYLLASKIVRRKSHIIIFDKESYNIIRLPISVAEWVDKYIQENESRNKQGLKPKNILETVFKWYSNKVQRAS